jgi:hypothetical protein
MLGKSRHDSCVNCKGVIGVKSVYVNRARYLFSEWLSNDTLKYMLALYVVQFGAR